MKTFFFTSSTAVNFPSSHQNKFLNSDCTGLLSLGFVANNSIQNIVNT